MKPFKVLESRILALNFDHLDNNDLIPSYHARRVSKTGLGQYLLNNHRYLPGLPPREKTDFPLNRQIRKEASILIPGLYFATEITYEQAVWAVLDEGFKVVISNEIGHQFKQHSYRNGLLAIELLAKEVKILEGLPSDETVIINLGKLEVISSAGRFAFTLDSDVQDRLINGISEIEETLNYEDAIAKYEAEWRAFDWS